MGHDDGGPGDITFLQSNDFFIRMEFISFDIFCQSMETRFSHFLLNLSMLTFGIKVNKDLTKFPSHKSWYYRSLSHFNNIFKYHEQ